MTGICKECLKDVPMDESTQVVKGVWEYEGCGYPNAKDDFWQVFEDDDEKGVEP